MATEDPVLRLRGLRAGNLKNLDLDLQQGRWTALHGPSGAGKSALLFGILEPVSKRRFRVLYDPRSLPSSGEAWLLQVADTVQGLQPVIALAGEIPRGRAAVEVATALDLWPSLGRAWKAIGTRHCLQCEFDWRPPDLAALLALSESWPNDAPVYVFSAAGGTAPSTWLQAGWTRVRLGTNGLARLEEAPDPLPPDAWLLLDRFRWQTQRSSRYQEALQEALRRSTALLIQCENQEWHFDAPEVCPRCQKQVPPRTVAELLDLREAPDVKLLDQKWQYWCEAPLKDWLEIPATYLGNNKRKLEFLQRTGLGHLSPVRALGTLSLGESRRLEMVGQLGQVRRDQLILFDEPGMGLHGGERHELASLLRELVTQGNTVLTADPAREFIESADGWVLLGPGGGPQGGTLVDQGDANRLPELESWKPPQARPVEADAHLVFPKIRKRFLQIEELRLPLQRIVAIAGVSGSGKSTLLEEVLVPRIREQRDLDGRLPFGGIAVLLERALGSAVFSTVATLSGAWTAIRQAFAEGEEGRIRGLSPADFVAREGRGGCPTCKGYGVDVDRLSCATCEGLGLRADLLDVRVRQRSLREWLQTPLSRLEKRLPHEGSLRTLTRHLIALGMGDRRFGERGRNLSLGERSRIALAKALAGVRSDRPKLFLLDEPCLGLPTWEARKVIDLLRDLSGQGHSFWVVDHHEVLLRSADWLVELGPGAGPDGGKLLFTGPPAQVRNAGTPTGKWLQQRRRKPKPPPQPPPYHPPRSSALPDDWERKGRQVLEQELLRELATRSVLVTNALGESMESASDNQAQSALPPTAWPQDPRPDARLGEVLGIALQIEEAVRQHGDIACENCGGRGPFTDLVAGVRATLPAGPHLFTTPLKLPAEAAGQARTLLQAAGFRRLWRKGKSLNLKKGVEIQSSDEVWLDRFDPSAESDVGRLRDLEHHAKLLGAGGVRAYQNDQLQWEYQTGRCSDCGKGDAEHPMPVTQQLHGRSWARLQSQPLQESLEHLIRHTSRYPIFRTASELLQSTSLLRHPLQKTWQSLTLWEQRLARLAGWLFYPVEGVVLLHDQPLSGLPATLARRLAQRMLGTQSGAHRFTDPEAFGNNASPRRARKAQRGSVEIQGFSLELDFFTWSNPAWVEADVRLRDALGLSRALQDHYLRSEEARLRGWRVSDLRRPVKRHGRVRSGARICSVCHGVGQQFPHPEVGLSCQTCSGSGWSRDTAALEDRGLRWVDLGQQSLQDLAAHFAATRRIADPLKIAVEFGMGSRKLDAWMFQLPLGARVLAPLAGFLAAETDSGDWQLGAPLAGLNELDAQAVALRLLGYLHAKEVPNWRDHHPSLGALARVQSS